MLAYSPMSSGQWAHASPAPVDVRSGRSLCQLRQLPPMRSVCGVRGNGQRVRPPLLCFSRTRGPPRRFCLVVLASCACIAGRRSRALGGGGRARWCMLDAGDASLCLTESMLCAGLPAWSRSLVSRGPVWRRCVPMRRCVLVRRWVFSCGALQWRLISEGFAGRLVVVAVVEKKAGAGGLVDENCLAVAWWGGWAVVVVNSSVVDAWECMRDAVYAACLWSVAADLPVFGGEGDEARW
ncbi:hypothetical protein DFH27DRAFT_95352 [Peziza echinospora]|nr:hypothetical protein DFH27DRAFT_95352 [Peziza echinospora]